MGLLSPASLYGPLKDACLYIKHRRRHVIDLDDNFKKLSLKHGSLLASRNDTERKLRFKKKNDKYCELWKHIQDITRKYEEMESKFKNWRGEDSPRVPRNKNVASGGEDSTSSAQVAQNQHISRRKIWTRRFFNNARLDKDVMKLIEEIDALKIEVAKPEMLVMEEMYVQWKNAPEIDHMPQGKYVKKILEYLENKSTKRIGIFGEPQVGKSTVLKVVNNYVLEGIPKYDIVIWVNYPSKDFGDVKEKMQQEILKSIHEHDEQSLGHNAAKINEALVKRKYLLILDDVYETIDLANLGIHDDHELGKIVIGATGEGVLKRMKVDERILIDKLGSDDAEKFFKQCLGVEPSDLSTIQPYIKKIIELLGGHIGPLDAIANVMKELGNDNKDLDVWEAIVDELQSPNSPENLELGALEKAYKILYERLKENNLKKCLLYVALFPVGYHAHKNYLVECWKAEEFLHGYHTYKKARSRGTLVFRRLTESRLLEWSRDQEYLKMSLLFRKVALQIPYPDEGDNKLLVRNISNMFDQPHDQDWHTAKRISLMCGKLNSVPTWPECDNTSTLLLQSNLGLIEITNPFFVNMGNLRVLDLQHTGINGLPKSILNLGYLKCLYLNDCCSLKSLPTEIKKLNQLELLDIRRTLMRCLPDEIWYLTTLRCLRISVYSLAAGGTEDYSKEIVVTQQELLPCFSPEFLKLKYLEELTVHVDPQTPDRGLIVDQIKKALEEVHKDLEVKWEPEESYLHSSNNVVANGSGLNESAASNDQDTTLPHSSCPITKHVNQLENTEGSTSTANSQHTGSTKEWVEKRFQGRAEGLSETASLPSQDYIQKLNIYIF